MVEAWSSPISGTSGEMWRSGASPGGRSPRRGRCQCCAAGRRRRPQGRPPGAQAPEAPSWGPHAPACTLLLLLLLLAAGSAARPARAAAPPPADAAAAHAAGRSPGAPSCRPDCRRGLLSVAGAGAALRAVACIRDWLPCLAAGWLAVGRPMPLQGPALRAEGAGGGWLKNGSVLAHLGERRDSQSACKPSQLTCKARSRSGGLRGLKHALASRRAAWCSERAPICCGGRWDHKRDALNRAQPAISACSACPSTWQRRWHVAVCCAASRPSSPVWRATPAVQLGLPIG